MWTAQSEIIYYVICALFEFCQDSVHSLSLRCAIDFNCLFLLSFVPHWQNQRSLLLPIGDFVSFLKTAVLSRSQNRRFCLIHKFGDFVSFSESAILSHFQNRRFCPTLKTAVLSRIRSECQVVCLNLRKLNGCYNGITSPFASAFSSHFQWSMYCTADSGGDAISSVERISCSKLKKRPLSWCFDGTKNT